MPYTDVGTTETKLILIAGHAKRDPDIQFTSLAHLLDAEFLMHCFAMRQIYKSGSVRGVDVRFSQFKELDTSLPKG